MLKSLFCGLVERVGGVGAGVGGGNAAVVLGRWGIQYDPRIIDCKVFQANEDHCGCCVVPKKEETVVMAVPAHLEKSHTHTKALVVISEEESYLVPYVM